MKPILENPGIRKVGQNIKYDWIVLRRYGIELQGILCDTMIASYLLNPTKHNHNLSEIAREYLDIPMTEYKEVVGTEGRPSPSIKSISRRQGTIAVRMRR